MTEDSENLSLDEIARELALSYASSTMHYVRRKTVDWSYTDSTESWFQRQAVTYHGHLGKPPIAIDQMAQRRFETAVRDNPAPGLLGRVIVLGEEAALADWDPNRSGRATIFRCDPIDGSSSLSHSGDGFSTVVTVESRRDPGQPWKHYGGAIVRSDGLTVSWSRRAVFRHDVVLDTRSDLSAGESPPMRDLGTVPPLGSRDIDELHRRSLAMSGATVAAQSSRRRELLLARYAQLIVQADYFDFKAGSLSVWPMCTGLLGWIIELNPTTIHDSIHLFPFVSLGGRVVDFDYRPLNVLRLVEENAGPESLEKIFPAYIAYIDEESLDLIKSCGP